MLPYFHFDGPPLNGSRSTESTVLRKSAGRVLKVTAWCRLQA